MKLIENREMNIFKHVERLFSFYSNFIYKRGLKLTAGVGFSLLVLVAVLTVSSYQELRKQTELRAQSAQILSYLKEINLIWMEAVATSRGYILSQDPYFYEQFHVSIGKMFSKLNDFSLATIDDPEHQKLLSNMRAKLSEKVSHMKYTLQLVSNQQVKDALDFFKKSSKELSVESINQLINQIEQHENVKSEYRVQRLKEKSDRLIFIIVSSIVVSFALLWVVMVLLRNELSSRKQSQIDLFIAREKAIEASHAKSDFLAKMSHEIRTPLNAIIGLSDVLLESKLDEEQKKYMTIMQRSGQTLLALVNDVLDLAKVESGKIELNETVINLNETIKFCIDLLSFRASQKGLVLESEIEIEYPNVKGDRNRIQQILINLISNAIKFTSTGKITVRVTQLTNRGNQVYLVPEKYRYQFSVADTGTGIKPEDQQKVFQKFGQVKDQQIAQQPHSEGTGLGLTIASELVGLMGGELKLESVYGKGSRFYFAIEMEVTHVEDAFLRLDKKTIYNTSHHVLVVDDNHDNRLLIETYLKKAGHTYESVENGEQAVQKFKQGQYTLVLMDMHMPVMDGFRATRSIRYWEAETQREPTPIIALTAYALQEEISKTLEVGCDLHLTKPIRKETLLKAISQFEGKKLTA